MEGSDHGVGAVVVRRFVCAFVFSFANIRPVGRSLERSGVTVRRRTFAHEGHSSPGGIDGAVGRAGSNDGGDGDGKLHQQRRVMKIK